MYASAVDADHDDHAADDHDHDDTVVAAAVTGTAFAGTTGPGTAFARASAAGTADHAVDASGAGAAAACWHAEGRRGWHEASEDAIRADDAGSGESAVHGITSR